MRYRYGVLVLLAGITSLAGCTERIVRHLDVAEIELAPQAIVLGVDAEHMVAVELYDAERRRLVEHPVAWSSLDPTVATVDGSGRVRGVTRGTTRVRATSGGVAGFADVNVVEPVLLHGSPAELSFVVASGETARRELSVTASGPLAGALSATASAAWIRTAAPTAVPGIVTVDVVSEGLAVGEHSGAVRLTAPGAAERVVPVMLTVVASDDPVIATHPAELRFERTQSGAEEVATVAITNAGGGTLEGLATSLVDDDGAPVTWLVATLSSTSSPAVLTVETAGGELAVGEYAANVRVTATGAAPAMVPVEMDVRADGSGGDTPSLVLTASSLVFSAGPDAPVPAPATVGISSTGAAIDGLTLGIDYPEGTVVEWLSAELGDASTPTVVTVTADAGGLAPGSHQAWLRVNAPESSKTIAVRFEIESGPDPSGPVLSVDPSHVAFEVAEGSANPAPAVLSIENSGEGTLSGIGTAVTYASGQPGGWLSTDLSTSTAPAELELAVDADGLAVGSYDATVRLSAPGVASVDVDVSLRVTSATTPIISIGAPDIHLEGEVGGDDPAAVNVSVTNSGGGVLAGLDASVEFDDGEPDGWLDVSLDGSGAPATLTVQASVDGLSEGTYHATVSVSGALATTGTLGVTLEVTDSGPILDVGVPSVAFTGTVGGEVLPGSIAVPILNLGGGTLIGLDADVEYEDGEPAGWLDLDLDVGGLGATLTAETDIDGLGAGTHNATITLSLDGAETVEMDAVLVLVPAATPVIGLSLSDVEFSAALGSGDPAPRVVLVSNVGLGLLLGLDAAIEYADGEPTGWLDADLSGSLAPANLTLDASLGGLGAGVYHATVTVSATLAGSVSIDVVFVVNPDP